MCKVKVSLYITKPPSCVIVFDLNRKKVVKDDKNFFEGKRDPIKFWHLPHKVPEIHDLFSDPSALRMKKCGSKSKPCFLSFFFFNERCEKKYIRDS